MDYKLAEEERQQKRLSPSILEAVKVRSINDIKGVIASLNNSASASPVMLRTNFKTQTVDVQLAVSTQSKNQRDLILDGLADVKSKMQCISAYAEESSVNGVSVKPAKMADQHKAFHKVDPVISRYTGGYRDGYLICWNLSDGYKYQYDIFEHKLSREATSASSSGAIQTTT